MFENFAVRFEGVVDSYQERPQIFKNMNITTLVGENGVGKITLMSLIANIFNNLQRNQSGIPSDFTICYLKHIKGKDRKVTIKNRMRTWLSA